MTSESMTFKEAVESVKKANGEEKINNKDNNPNQLFIFPFAEEELTADEPKKLANFIAEIISSRDELNE
jgi:hypothetical protein